MGRIKNAIEYAADASIYGALFGIAMSGPPPEIMVQNLPNSIRNEISNEVHEVVHKIAEMQENPRVNTTTRIALMEASATLYATLFATFGFIYGGATFRPKQKPGKPNLRILR